MGEQIFVQHDYVLAGLFVFPMTKSDKEHEQEQKRSPDLVDASVR